MSAGVSVERCLRCGCVVVGCVFAGADSLHPPCVGTACCLLLSHQVWLPILLQLVKEAANNVQPAAAAAFGENDPRFYIKVCLCVPAAVCGLS